jgi:hypothetical protein
MTLALLICIIGGAIYLITSITDRYPEYGELGRLAFAVGLLAYLLK